MSFYTFKVEINKQTYNKNLYKFCEYFEDIIKAIIYTVKTKTYKIIVKSEEPKFQNKLIMKASEIFKDLKYEKDYKTYRISEIKFNELERKCYDCMVSCINPKMFLYYCRHYAYSPEEELEYKFNINYLSILIFDILYNFKLSDIDEIICWYALFFEFMEQDDHEDFINSCIARYWDEEHKVINIRKMNGAIDENKRIPEEYIINESCIDISEIPDVYVFDVIRFTQKLNVDVNRAVMYYDQKINKMEDKTIKVVNKFKESEIIDDEIYISIPKEKENSIIKNTIFDNEEEEEDDYEYEEDEYEDEEYFEIMRTRRIKKSFMINN